MPNPTRPMQNSRPFDPDKGLPLIGERPLGFTKRGEGASKDAKTQHQMYCEGEEVEVLRNPKLPSQQVVYKKKGKK